MHGKILIVDDTATNRIVLKVKLAASFYAPVQARSGAEALRCLATEAIDLVILGTNLADMSVNDLIRRIRSLRDKADLPLLLVASVDQRAERIAAFDAGLDDCLIRPVSDDLLLARVRSLLRIRDESAALALPGDGGLVSLAEPAGSYLPPGRVVLVADRPETALRWRAALAPHLPDQIDIRTREEALGAAADAQPDLFVIAADLGVAGAGLQLMADLRCRSASRAASFCMVVPPEVPHIAVAALDLGANGVLPTGFDGPEAAARIRALIRRKHVGDTRRAAVQRRLEMAVIDPLTGLHNRRYALPALARMRAEATQGNALTAVMIIDVDRFKSVNDRFGHAAGDAVLVQIAQRLSVQAAAMGLVARIGGEEFLIAGHTFSAEAAKAFADRLCHAIQREPIILPNGAGMLRVTVSIGLAVVGAGQTTDEAMGDVLHRADCALMVAKGGGRNRVTLSRNAA